ncbi:MAG: patatin-like phospholipase family protein [Minicystis sp.]
MTETAERPDDAYQSPTLSCDLVMKGGIASGVVYPPAILKLARTYRLRGIGGASAGAIAAAAAAAAEYGRHEPKAHAGFRGLEELRADLESGKRIQELFEPAKATAVLYRFLMDLQRHAAKDEPGAEPGPLVWLGRITWALLARVPLWLCAGALVALGIVHLVMRPLAVLSAARLAPDAGSIGLALLVWALAGASVYAGALAAGVWRLKRGFDALCARDRTFFGFCLGSRGKDEEQPLRLTDWLHQGINRMAGYEAGKPPLTIDELAARSIDFRMVTTNLSHAQPVILPRKEGGLFFRRSDFERLFPPSVVAYLVHPESRERSEDPPEVRDARAREGILAGERDHGLRLPEDYYPLPKGGCLPVIVAVRLSLSFPILLGQVRLYSLKASKREEGKKRAGGDPIALTPADFEENWFSDGGIAANFPLSIFDRWMPD